jgi:hypothetical protein
MAFLFSSRDDFIVNLYNQINYISEKIMMRMVDSEFTPECISVLIETAFWASLHQNEGRRTNINIAFISSNISSSNDLLFMNTIPYNKSSIVNICHSISDGQRLAVINKDNDLKIVGITKENSLREFLNIEIIGAGLLKIHLQPFHPYAIIDGQNRQILGSTKQNFAIYMIERLKKMYNNNDINIKYQFAYGRVIRDIVIKILSYHHGGTILLVPSENGDWLQSLNPFLMRLSHSDTRIYETIKEIEENEEDRSKFTEIAMNVLDNDSDKMMALRVVSDRNSRKTSDVVCDIASLSQVDGAIVMTYVMNLLGFGAKVDFRSNAIAPIYVFKPVQEKPQVVASRLEDLGGMRHQSAARFIMENKETVAIVVSQDCHVSVMNWEENLKSVRVLNNAEWWI